MFRDDPPSDADEKVANKIHTQWAKLTRDSISCGKYDKYSVMHYL